MTTRRGRLRIVGGDWRGRRLSFPDLPGVRPSPDRLREALFNWLAPVITGARCLDLFAGSGALGIEALSRDAGETVFVDRDRKVLDSVQDHLHTLGAAGRGLTHCSEARRYLSTACGEFDIVFLDPPFYQGFLLPTLEALHGHLKPDHRVYAEFAHGDEPAWPGNTRVLKTTRAGRVGAALLRLEAGV